MILKYFFPHLMVSYIMVVKVIVLKEHGKRIAHDISKDSFARLPASLYHYCYLMSAQLSYNIRYLNFSYIAVRFTDCYQRSTILILEFMDFPIFIYARHKNVIKEVIILKFLFFSLTFSACWKINEVLRHFNPKLSI